MHIGVKETAEILKDHSKILIITHQSPDGDTLGSGFGLYFALTKLGKKARVICADEISQRYSFLFDGYKDEDFEPDLICAVDVADTKLIGERLKNLHDKVDLCIDHHPSNTEYAKKLYLNSTASATCEIIYGVIKELGVAFDEKTGTCIYTGIATDTGCFRYSNTTPLCHRIAAEMMETGVNISKINTPMFETKSLSRISLEQQALATVEYHFDKKCAMICITREMLETSGADEAELDGISPIPRQIEGVEIGVTMREKQDGSYKISVRTNDDFDASAICAAFGGGGHKKAAGCVINGGMEKAKKVLIEAIGDYLKR